MSSGLPVLLVNPHVTDEAILVVNCRPQSSQMKDPVLSEDLAAGTD